MLYTSLVMSSIRAVLMDFSSVDRKEDGMLRTMNTDKVFHWLLGVYRIRSVTVFYLLDCINSCCSLLLGN